jgi:hypothetical protein
MNTKFNEHIDSIRSLFTSVDKCAVTDQAIYGFLLHNKKLNNNLRLNNDLNLYSVLYMSIDECHKDKNGFYKVNISFDLSWLKEGSYYHSFPVKIKQNYAPQKIDRSDLLKWNPEENIFLYQDKKSTLKESISKIIIMHLKTTRNISGIPNRAYRAIRWGLQYPLLLLIKIMLLIVNVTSEKRKIIKRDIINNKTNIQFDSQYNYHINEFYNVKINFFGMDVYIKPLMTYCSINLIAYIICYYLRFKPPILKYLFNNTYLTVLYAILTYSIMYYVIPKTLNLVINGINSSINMLINDKIPIIDNK